MLAGISTISAFAVCAHGFGGGVYPLLGFKASSIVFLCSCIISSFFVRESVGWCRIGAILQNSDIFKVLNSLIVVDSDSKR